MNIKDITKDFQINKEFLDTIDFIPFLKGNQMLSMLMTTVEIFVFLNHIELPPELKNEVFNYYDEEDFKNYLEKRYSEKVFFYPIQDYLVDFREN